MHIKKVRIFGVLALSMFLGACTTPMFTMPPGPEDYRVGFHAGCDAGYSAAGSPFYERREDVQPGRSDPNYLRGWQIGFQRCKKNYDRIQTTVYSILGPSL